MVNAKPELDWIGNGRTMRGIRNYKESEGEVGVGRGRGPMGIYVMWCKVLMFKKGGDGVRPPAAVSFLPPAPLCYHTLPLINLWQLMGLYKMSHVARRTSPYLHLQALLIRMNSNLYFTNLKLCD